MRNDCVFCRIVAGTEPAVMAAWWPDTIAFFPLAPVTPGHTLIVPRMHVRDALENTTVTAVTVGRAVEYAGSLSSVNILTSVGRAATQSVMHLHIHVVPRHEGDQLMLPWGTTGDPHEPHRCRRIDELEKELEELRDAVTRPATARHTAGQLEQPPLSVPARPDRAMFTWWPLS